MMHTEYGVDAVERWQTAFYSHQPLTLSMSNGEVVATVIPVSLRVESEPRTGGCPKVTVQLETIHVVYPVLRRPIIDQDPGDEG